MTMGGVYLWKDGRETSAKRWPTCCSATTIPRAGCRHFLQSADQLPPFTDYSMKGRTYRDFTGEPLYPFGYGLSYTTFAYRNLKLPTAVSAGEPVKVSVDIENRGRVMGEEVVQLYLKAVDLGRRMPNISLHGFRGKQPDLGQRTDGSATGVLTGTLQITGTAKELR
jgi:hypothetical protein